MHPKLSKKILLETAKNCRTFKKMSEKLKIRQATISQTIKDIGMYDKIKGIFLENKALKPSWNKQYTKKQMMELINSNNSMSEVGQSLGVTRERVRQILNKLQIHDKAMEILSFNRIGIKLPERNLSGIFCIYFKNDPKRKRYLGYSRKIRNAIRKYYGMLKNKKCTVPKLAEAEDTFGLENFRWKIIKECPLGSLRSEAHRIQSKNPLGSLNKKTIGGKS